MLGAGRVSEPCSRIEATALSAEPTELEAVLVELEDALTSTGSDLEAQLGSASTDPASAARG
jgi:hypothetical protein